MDIVKKIIKVEVYVNFKYRKFILFIVVCYKGNLNLVKILMDIGVDVNFNDGIDILLIVVC